MQRNIFNQLIAEVKQTYSHKIPVKSMLKVTGSQDIYQAILPNYPDIEYIETFWVLLMNRGNRVLGIKHISTGGISGTVVDVRIILQAALLANSSGIVLIHNHPSGTLQPSSADMQITSKTKDAAKLMDITVLDHIIFTLDMYYSFADEGVL